MSTVIKNLIKGLAALLAIIIIVNIFYFMASLINGFKKLTDDDNIGIFYNDKEDYSKEYINDNYNNLNIELSYSKLKIRVGSEFKIETNNENIEILKKKNTVYISESKKMWENNLKYEIILYVPANKEFENVYINSGTGKADISFINSQKLDFNAGVASTNITNINISKEANLKTGTGAFTMNSGTIHNLTINAGVGKISITGKLLGENIMNSGLGNIELFLSENINNYQFVVFKGKGSIKLNDDSIQNGFYSVGTNIITINGGLGSINIETS